MSQDTCDCEPSPTLSWDGVRKGQATEDQDLESAMGTIKSIEREWALEWLARQLSWERTLNHLRQDAGVEDRKAA